MGDLNLPKSHATVHETLDEEPSIHMSESSTLVTPGPLYLQPRQHETDTIVSQDNSILKSDAQVNPPPIPHLRGINWGTMIIQKDQEQPSNIPEPELSFSNTTNDTYLSAYFQSIHSHWPLIHRMMATQLPDFSVLMSSVRMLGAWTTGTVDGLRLAMETHESLLPNFHNRLVG